MQSEKILLAGADPRSSLMMRLFLQNHGFEVIDARSGEETLHQSRGERADLVLLDLETLGIGGFEMCREIRAASKARIIVLSASDSERDIVRALDAGADDYVVKPGRTGELLARIRAELRRSSAERAGSLRSLTLGAGKIDFETRLITTKNGQLHLAPKEFALLRLLISNAGKVLSHRKMLQSIWGPDYGEEVESLRVAINQLRKKIEVDPSEPKHILTEPRVGYRFELTAQS